MGTVSVPQLVRHIGVDHSRLSKCEATDVMLGIGDLVSCSAIYRIVNDLNSKIRALCQLTTMLSLMMADLILCLDCLLVMEMTKYKYLPKKNIQNNLL